MLSAAGGSSQERAPVIQLYYSVHSRSRKSLLRTRMLFSLLLGDHTEESNRWQVVYPNVESERESAGEQDVATVCITGE